MLIVYIKSCPTISDFLKMAREPLLLFQIPHHGSSHNNSISNLKYIPTEMFFWHDEDCTRINKQPGLIAALAPCKLVLIDSVTYLICHIHV